MIRSLYFENEKSEPAPAAVEDYLKILKNPDTMLWVDFSGEDPAHVENIMRDIFAFHPLAIDDALRETHVPKVDDWEGYIYLVLHDISFDRAVYRARDE